MTLLQAAKRHLLTFYRLWPHFPALVRLRQRVFVSPFRTQLRLCLGFDVSLRVPAGAGQLPRFDGAGETAATDRR